MAALNPGTLCYLVHLVEMEEFVGRVVEVVARRPDEPDCYTVSAPWAREMFSGRDLLAQRRHLLPFCPPGIPTRRRSASEV